MAYSIIMRNEEIATPLIRGLHTVGFTLHDAKVIGYISAVTRPCNGIVVAIIGILRGVETIFIDKFESNKTKSLEHGMVIFIILIFCIVRLNLELAVVWYRVIYI